MSKQVGGVQMTKRVLMGVAVAAILALGGTAKAVTLDAGVFAPGNGDAANPIVMNVTNPGSQGQTSGIFLDTINFDLGIFTKFNMTSTTNGITFFGVPIFENNNDTQVVEAATSFSNLPLADLGLPRDYHLHPQGVLSAGGSYTLTMWGTEPVPLPAALYLFGTGVLGLAALARRKGMA